MDTDDTGADGDVEIRMSAKDAAKLIETLSSARYLTDDVRAHALYVADVARRALAAATPRAARVQTITLAALHDAVEGGGAAALAAGRDPAAEPVLIEMRGALYGITNVCAATIHTLDRTAIGFVAVVADAMPVFRRPRGPAVVCTAAGGEG